PAADSFDGCRCRCGTVGDTWRVYFFEPASGAALGAIPDSGLTLRRINVGFGPAWYYIGVLGCNCFPLSPLVFLHPSDDRAENGSAVVCNLTIGCILPTNGHPSMDHSVVAA